MSIQDFLHIQPFQDAEDALDNILSCLKVLAPFKLWMLTRVDDNDWTVIRSLDEGYGTKFGNTLEWSGTYCSRMVAGEGPMFAEDAQQYEAYSQAKMNNQFPLAIGAYIGLPIFRQDGSLSGTLCALDPVRQALLSEQKKQLLFALTRTLSTLQVVYSDAELARRRAERYRYEAETDALTGVCNRRGWDLALKDQEAATLRTGQNAMVAIIDLDDLKLVNDSMGHSEGDKLLKKAAQVMRNELRANDVIARIGGDEFAVLINSVSASRAAHLAKRLKHVMDCANASASMGYALRLECHSMEQTCEEADNAMYRAKNERRLFGDHLKHGLISTKTGKEL
jgi:diguanylate cyclase (GGDEF)-like protein